MEIKDIYQKMECSKEDKEKIYRAILQKRRRNFAGSHFMKAAVIALCLLVGGTTARSMQRFICSRQMRQQSRWEMIKLAKGICRIIGAGRNEKVR